MKLLPYTNCYRLIRFIFYLIYSFPWRSRWHFNLYSYLLTAQNWICYSAVLHSLLYTSPLLFGTYICYAFACKIMCILPHFVLYFTTTDYHVTFIWLQRILYKHDSLRLTILWTNILSSSPIAPSCNWWGLSGLLHCVEDHNYTSSKIVSFPQLKKIFVILILDSWYLFPSIQNVVR